MEMKVSEIKFFFLSVLMKGRGILWGKWITYAEDYFLLEVDGDGGGSTKS